ncbi:hypothetical protein CC78DRAFT_533109 [Lojkania enalia]|uniref:Uncharacterized protein n=1 Tax=Lojkania enalia TaxID=147567 RepID=A0A9P4K8F4_9PLEO|nr:hypothetical protein CC78DRAFT_533109 [Didymosphaeria enalia]
MSAKDEKETMGRESSDDDNVDLEKGVGSPEKNAEEAEPVNLSSCRHIVPTTDMLQAPEKAEDDLEAELERHLSRKSSRKTKLAPEIYPLMDLDHSLVGWESQEDPANPRYNPFF